MQLSIFCVYDAKAQAYLPPFFLPRKQMAVRAFAECVNSSEHQFGKWPNDYTLFHIGAFNDETGLIDSFAPVSLGNGLEHLQVKEVEDYTAAETARDLKLIQGVK